MINWLQYAEDHGEKVHILGHIPPRQCMGSFSWNFDRIVNRYESTIAGQFYGHTHNDQFVIHYDQNDSQRPVSMVFFHKILLQVIFFFLFCLGVHHTIVNDFFAFKSWLSCLYNGWILSE